MDAPAGRGRATGEAGEHPHQTASASFTWTRKKITDALTACLKVFREENDDLFLGKKTLQRLCQSSMLLQILTHVHLERFSAHKL